MSLNVERELARLEAMAVRDLKRKYEEVFREECRSRNRQWLLKRIIWRMQANAEGGLSERALQRAAEIADDSDLRMNPPRVKPAAASTPAKPNTATPQLPSDNRLPPTGSIISRTYKGMAVDVRVLANGFEYQGDVFKSLSAVAKHVTGTHTSGNLFFNLRKGDRS